MVDVHDKQAGQALAADKPRSLIARFFPLVVIALASGGLLLSGAHRQLTFENLLLSRDTLMALVATHWFMAIAAYALIYIAAVALSLPGAVLLTITGGFMFGVAVGGAATVLAATIGAALVFLAARSALGEMLRRRAGTSLASFRDGFERDAASYLLFLRLVPVFPFFLVNLAPALLNVPLGTFVWTTFVGIIPATFAYSFAGAGLDSIAAAQKQAFEACLASGAVDCKAHIHLKQLVTPELIYAFAALGLVALIPVVLRRWRSPAAVGGSAK